MSLSRRFATAVGPFIGLTLAVAAAPSFAYVPESKTLYTDGPSGRYLLGGRWQFRADAGDKGLSQHWQNRGDSHGWRSVQVPHAWNSGDPSSASMAGSIGWYRKDFVLPKRRAAAQWLVRFESANYRSRVWLNGRSIGTNSGAYLPFELLLSKLKPGNNRLVVRVDSRHLATDFPPSRFNEGGTPGGGWWNYGGLLREVYLRRLDNIDWTNVSVRPDLECPTCSAKIALRADLRSVLNQRQRISVVARVGGQKINLGQRSLGARAKARFQATMRLEHPQLWSPNSPHLYQVQLQAISAGRVVATYSLHTGVRSIRVVNGRLLLNGNYVNLRGVGVHEDARETGAAVTSAFRQQLVTEAKALGATVIRTHYPLHPQVHELADRLGILIWSEVPVFQVKSELLGSPKVRSAAISLVRRNILANGNHPSVLLWSIANELSSRLAPAQRKYFARAAGVAHSLDPSRPVAISTSGYPSVGCQSGYEPVNVIGINDYFGWYPGPGGQIFDRTKLGPYLDSVRACYPTKAIAITEFGAEANRDGPVDEKGTWAFQQDFVNYQLGVFATKPWLSGAIYWALNEFWVRPNWDGGNPRPKPPIHQKGLITYDWQRKPAWADMQRLFTSVDQIGSSAPSG